MGKTQAGDRCKRQVADADFCHAHNPGADWDLAEMDDDGRMSQAAFARLVGRSRQRVHQWIEEGKIELDDAGKLDVADSLRAMVAHGDMSRSGLPLELYDRGLLDESDDLEGESAKELARRHLIAKINYQVQRARKAKLEADEMEAVLLPRDVVQRRAYEIARTTRNQLLAIADRVSAELAGATEAAEIHETLTNELSQALSELADLFEFGPYEEGAAA